MKLIIFLGMVLAAQAGIFDLSHNWNTLKVTWNPNPIGGWAFDKLPRTLSENKHFELRDDLCETGGGKLLGQRYWYKQDPALNLLYDKNGVIAGIATSIPKSKFTPPAPLQNKNYQDDGDYWTLAAYFIDPSLICGAGRTKEEMETTGTGTGLWIQMGPNAVTDCYKAPANETEVKTTKWGSGKCFWTMGQHYWYDITKDMSCDDVVPNCLLYNGGQLNAFCFATNGNFESKRYDNPHPTNKVVPKFMDPMPDCFNTDPSYEVQSTIHVYFYESPRVTSWC
jgi:charged multivesicular body protein 7